MTRTFHLSISAALAVGVALLLALAAPQQAAAASCPGADKSPRQISSQKAARAVECLINKKRRSNGKGGFKHRVGLVRAARSHTRRMQKANCFRHECPGERSLVGRYERASYLPCGCSWGAAENIGWGAGRKGTPREIVTAWMHSPEHRRNILGSFDHFGAAVRWGSPSRRHARAGTYTVDFGYKR